MCCAYSSVFIPLCFYSSWFAGNESISQEKNKQTNKNKTKQNKQTNKNKQVMVNPTDEET